MQNPGNDRKRAEAHKRYVEIIDHARRYIHKHGRTESIVALIADLGIVPSTFRLACKARPDLIEYENQFRSVRFRFSNGDGVWSEWCDWSRPPVTEKWSDDMRSRISEGVARAKAAKLTAKGAKPRECLMCRSYGRKTLVLGGPGERYCDPCRQAARHILYAEGCSSGRRVGLSGYSVTSQIQPRAA